jgi:hypothetical protein
MRNLILSLCALSIFSTAAISQTNTFPPSGNAGIGTLSTNPYGFVRDLTISAGTSGNVDAGLTLQGFRTTNDPFAGIQGYHGNQRVGTIFFYRDGSDSSGAIVFFTSNTGSSLERMKIDRLGNIGIGTSNPAAPLDIQRPVNITGANSHFYLRQSAGGSFGVKLSMDNTALTGGKNWELINTSDDASEGGGKFFFFNRTDSKYGLVMDSDGNTGIGTLHPTQKLSVNGNIAARKVIITQTVWSDYVFASDYKLRSLGSLEAFIKQNHHLPDIPSAKEVEEKGISVGDNQALLLKKIEELTLYIIDLKKITEKQQRQINRLKHLGYRKTR